MISIIVAIDEKRGIGKNNKLMWHIPEDLKRFKQLTLGHPVIMGRKTFESIGKPLPNRINIVVTRDTSFNHHKFCSSAKCDENDEDENVEVEEVEVEKEAEKVKNVKNVKDVMTHIIRTHSLEEALRQGLRLSSAECPQGKPGSDEIFIIGGGQIFKKALPMVDKLYLTLVKGDFGADTFFPDYSVFQKVISQEKGVSHDYDYQFLVLEK